MKDILLACCLLLSSFGAFAQGTPQDAAYRQQIAAFLDQWHDDAAHARPAYFDKIAANGVYIGTDKSEVWTRDVFKEWAKPHFARKSAWAFKATSRNIYWSEDRGFIWFNEQLDTQMGVCQASGVIRKGPSGFAIEHYQLSMAVPNEVTKDVTKTIRDFEAKAAPKLPQQK